MQPQTPNPKSLQKASPSFNNYTPLIFLAMTPARHGLGFKVSRPQRFLEFRDEGGGSGLQVRGFLGLGYDYGFKV